MTSLTEFQAGLAVGTVEAVDSGGIDVLLSFDAPHGTALNARIMSRFPRVNSYVIIPSEVGPIVGLVSRVRVDRAVQAAAEKPDDLVGTARPRRRVWVIPLGVLRESEGPGFEVRRGVLIFPTVGDPVLLPTSEQMAALTRATDAAGLISIGRSPLTGSSDVWVSIDRLFTRHLAVLGNTGSGKSCSVVTLVRRAIEQASQSPAHEGPPDLRVIVLDTNGEFADSFNDLPVSVRRLTVDAGDVGASEPANPQDPDDEGAQSPRESLRVPGWMWNSLEWTAFTLAKPGAQAPYVKRALVDLRSRVALRDPHLRRVSTIMGRYHTTVRMRVAQGSRTDFGPRQDDGGVVEALAAAATQLVGAAPQDVATALQAVNGRCQSIMGTCKVAGSKGPLWNPIDLADWQDLQGMLDTLLAACQEQQGTVVPIHEDDPVPFAVDELPELIELSALEEQTGNAVAWIAPMVFRLRALLSDRRLRAVACGGEETETLEGWLDGFLGPSQVTVVDLSLVPTGALQVVVGVMARLLFDAHERFRREHGRPLPTVIVAEEAHTYLSHRRGWQPEEGSVTPAELCAAAFDRIAREGRKFGLGLVVTSQRPSELSETVLSQCNTFLVHRIVNDGDQTLVRRLVPDALGDLLLELPSLPTRVGILMGWATDVPTVVEVHELEETYRPHSEDPPLFGVWAGTSPGSAGWAEVAGAWASKATDEQIEDPGEAEPEPLAAPERDISF